MKTTLVLSVNICCRKLGKKILSGEWNYNVGTRGGSGAVMGVQRPINYKDGDLSTSKDVVNSWCPFCKELINRCVDVKVLEGQKK